MNEDWLDVLAALLRDRVRFLVVGAHAMAVHGVPRGTQDLDIWIDATGDNPGRTWRALASFGAPLESLGISVSDFSRPGTVVQLGLPPNRIDLLTSLGGLESFAKAWDARVEQPIHGRVVPILGRADLIATKRATGRPKDLADLQELGEAHEPD